MGLRLRASVNIQINILGLIVCLIMIASENIGILAQRHSRYEDGSLRLVGGRTDNEGTVLIYHWSRWGAICDDYWDKKDAEVVCNQLGFPGAISAVTDSKFGKGRRKQLFSVHLVFQECLTCDISIPFS